MSWRAVAHMAPGACCIISQERLVGKYLLHQLTGKASRQINRNWLQFYTSVTWVQTDWYVPELRNSAQRFQAVSSMDLFCLGYFLACLDFLWHVLWHWFPHQSDVCRLYPLCYWVWEYFHLGRRTKIQARVWVFAGSPGLYNNNGGFI